MSQKPLSKEIRERLPRLLTSLVVVFILYLILNIAPGFVEGITMPGIDVGVDMVVRLAVMLIILIFLARVLTDIRVLGDRVTDLVVRQFGIKEEKSMKRAARDVIYIIIIILVVEAILPFLVNIPRIGDMLGTITGLVALGIFFVLAYDIGRILYDLVVSRAEEIADWLAGYAEKVKENQKGGE